MSCEDCEVVSKYPDCLLYLYFIRKRINKFKNKKIVRLCVSCQNKKDYSELSSEEKSIILLYEKNIHNGNQPLALEALREMIKLGIDDITVPK